MIECEACHRHFRTSEGSCPFCRAPWFPSTAVLNLLGGAITTIVLAACYGTVDKPPGVNTGTTGDTGDTAATGTTPP